MQYVPSRHATVRGLPGSGELRQTYVSATSGFHPLRAAAVPDDSTGGPESRRSNQKNKMKIFCKNINRYIEVPGGASLLQIASLPEVSLGFRPICALVNNKTEHLGFQIFAPKHVEFLRADSHVGREVYTRSLCMMTYRALHNIDETLVVRMCHSISNGLFCRIFDAGMDPVSIDGAFTTRLAAEMRRLAEEDLPFVRHERLTSDVIGLFRSQHLTDKVNLLETVREIYTSYYTLDGLADSFYGPLAPSTGHIRVFDIIPWHDGMLLLGPDQVRPELPASPLTQEKMFNAFTEHQKFNRVIRAASVGELNRAVERKESTDLINVAEAMHDKLIGRISDEIMRRREHGDASIILIAGPSSSGKTTTSKRLAIQLMTNLITPKLISLDDYFVNREQTPLDENGEYDYESLHALDLERFNSDIRALLRGEEINLPTYSFELGRRVEKERPLHLGENEVLIMEGIHGLNPELTASIPQRQVFKMYVSALTTLRIDNHNWISTSDNRLLRRIVRDNKYRHTSPEDTIRRWPSVRRGEQKWIFPFQENADATFNSSLLFEIAVMKPYAVPLLESVPHDVPEYTTAYRLLRFLQYFRPIPEAQVPATSLLREFLGGSAFRY